MNDLHTMMEKYAEMNAELMPALAQLDALKRDIQTAVRELGETVAHAGVTAQYRDEYERVTWNSKKLEGYAAAHPEIEQFRTISQVAPSVAIKVG